MKFDDLKRLPILYPHVKEQDRIAAYLDKQTKTIDQIIGLRRIDKAMGIVDTQITLLQEYRAALIYECVTGQRAVPN